MMKRKAMQKLTTAVLLSCSCLLAPYYAQAAETNVLQAGEEDIPSAGAHAGQTVAEHKENLWEVRLPNA